MNKAIIKNKYFLVFIYILIIDRFCKAWAYKNLLIEHKINDFLSLKLVMNRGISWGLLNKLGVFGFWILNIFIICLVVFLLIPYAHARWTLRRSIWGEIFVLSGAISNIIDRFYYNAVIDFISLHWGTFYWPTFNIADIFVVTGVSLMFFNGITEK